MKKEKIDSYIIEKLNLNDSAILEHSEHTELKERIIITYAKAFSLITFVIIGMVTLFVYAFRFPFQHSQLPAYYSKYQHFYVH